MSRRKKVIEEELTTPAPESMETPTVSNGEEAVSTETSYNEDIQMSDTNDKVTSPTIQASAEPVAKPKVVCTPESPYNPALEVRKLIRETMATAPKRNDSTTMPSPVTLQSNVGSVYFIMDYFDANTVESLWNKVKSLVTPEEFIIYLYTTMGLTPPKLYLYRKDLIIA